MGDNAVEQVEEFVGVRLLDVGKLGSSGVPDEGGRTGIQQTADGQVSLANG